MAKHRFTVVIEKDQDGFYAYCPQFQGCYTQGETYEQTLNNIKDAIRLHVEDQDLEQEDWKEPELINVTTLEISLPDA